MQVAPRRARGTGIVRPRRGRGFRPVVQDLEPRRLLDAGNPDAPTAYEQYMLELINQVRANPAAAGQRFVQMAQTDPVLEQATANWNLSQFLQEIDSFGPEPPLAFNTGLIEAARDHDAAMLAANSQFHSPSDYLTNPQTATAADGQAFYPPGTGWWATGENIFAFSQAVASRGTQAVVDYFDAAFFLDWGNPDFGHLKNLLAPGPAETSVTSGSGPTPFSEIGVGLLLGVSPVSSSGSGLNVGPDLVTQEFGWRQNVAFLTGVVYNDADNNSFYTPGEGVGGVTIQAIGTAGQGTFQATTWDSGGYSLQLPPGTYNVTATGNLPFPQSTVVTIGQDNVGWDVPLKPQAAADQPVPGDYNGDGHTDLAVYRASSAQWFIAGQPQPISFGWAGVDVPMPGDYDGTGKTEVAVYRPTTAQWFIAGHAQPISFGWAGVDIPVPGDYDGTGRTEIAVYRPATGQWFIAGHAQPISFGWPGVDIPVPGDYDGTGRTEIAVYRPTTGQWFIYGHAQPISYGWAGVDIPVPGDYGGAGQTEIAVYRPTTAQWFIAGQPQPIGFGWAGVDAPVAGDFDGDGKVDVAVYRPTTGQWFLDGSTTGVQTYEYGQGGAAQPVSSWLTGSSLSAGAPVLQFALGAGIPGAASRPPQQGPSASATTTEAGATAQPDRVLAAPLLRRKPGFHRAARKVHGDGGWWIGVRRWLKGAMA